MTAPNRQFAFDVMTIAIEGYIYDWARVRNVSRNEAGDVTGFEIKPDEPSFADGDPRDKWKLIEFKDVILAAEKVIGMGHPEIKVASSYRALIQLGYQKADASYIGATEADIIIQIAAFGELVFG